MQKNGVWTELSLKDQEMHKENCFKCYVMKTITCKQLRQMIADILAPNIDNIRAIKDNQFFYEFNVAPTDDEIDELVISSSCFDDEMKKFLLSEVGSAMIEDEWETSHTRIWERMKITY
jgi:hypothetical protein